MLPEKNILRTIEKQKRLIAMMREMLYTNVGKADIRGIYQTKEPLHEIPDDSMLSPLPEDKVWGGEGVYAWFKGSYTVPAELDGKILYAYPKTTYYEGTLWVNERITANFAAKIFAGPHGNHYSKRFTPMEGAKAGEKYEFALETYAWHEVPGTQPFLSERLPTHFYKVDDFDICVRDDELMHFVYDFNTLILLHEKLPAGSYHRAALENALHEVHLKLLYDPYACSAEEFRAAWQSAWPIIREELSRKNGTTAAYCGLTGHSHMDTAWLWPLTETEKKCARTYAHQLSLMEEYPEYRFIQSSAYHSDVMRRKYPEMFARMQQRVAEGRYEPNGGVWVECDCNLTGSEYLLRQFVWGQRFTRKYFNYTSDCFWLPDTFGYSYAIPQIMKGCDVDYFLTTKTGWNDTNKFPYTSFWWQGLDGTRVLSHINCIPASPDPKDLLNVTNDLAERRAAPMRLVSFGIGDGGGGPLVENIEMSLRVKDLEDVPRCEYTSVSDFMHKLEDTVNRPSTYADEIYLELHRGTLTNQHEIKRGNRKLEQALHNLELATVRKAVKEGTAASGEAIDPITNTLLVHQFHDILPGTSINCVHEETREVVGKAIETTNAMTAETLGANASDAAATVINTVSFDRNGTVYMPAKKAGVAGCLSQKFVNLEGKELLAVHGLNLPAFGGQCVSYTDEACTAASAFTMDGNKLTTPFASITFDDNGAIASMIDLSNGRELVNGLPFNTFLFGEDVPTSWDNWDIDADLEEKLLPAGKLVSREVVSDGAVELRIRSVWKLSDKLTIRQDMIFDAFSPMIAFDTEMDWQEEHRFLKAAFDTDLHADSMRSEIQFGSIRRSNHRSTDKEKARFEVCNHKYSDMSENSYGIAILNDCKYGISCENGSMRLSLHKGGMLPDSKGDKGLHRCSYAILPHAGAFAAENVIRPAYAFNYAPVVVEGEADAASLLAVDKANIIVETVKPCEDAQNAYILRLYEAAGDWTTASVSIAHAYADAKECNMLEENEKDIDLAKITFRPFEIKTIKIVY
ncbi:MAG: alpha-mannosidase [Clostridiales bacterium]|nr:alpha-mannosidase [Clostridiales bacterium]